MNTNYYYAPDGTYVSTGTGATNFTPFFTDNYMSSTDSITRSSYNWTQSCMSTEPKIQININNQTINLGELLKPYTLPSFKIIERNPNKVYEFIFQEKNKKDIHIKTICQEEDKFSLEYACFLAIAKYFYSQTLTFDGVIRKSYELMENKQLRKVVNKAIKTFEKQKKLEAEKKEEEERIKKIKENKRRKNNLRKKKAKEKKQEELCNTIKKAIENANKEE